ncbi:ArsR/SmtB family transcription factor [Psychrobacter sanguinis]|uniref:Metalloregulator ArsR/SmtB family transcription factor n=1 Tax=Psychrobacter sanguinis TaxID=861445 RepID=A0A844LZK2_9GAMM|nr:metalloregulator ArsR/SmtB family transcription factor [Psychrobacter sanguinis]
MSNAIEHEASKQDDRTNVLNLDTSKLDTSKLDIAALKASATKASALLKSLSHSDRLLLLCQLVESEACVRDLEQATGIKQPSLSQQLGVLRDNGLVNTRREGRQIFYSIASEDALAVMQVLYQRFCATDGDTK